MADTDRKIFPLEDVLALVMGKEGADNKTLAGYIVGRSLACDCCAAAAGPFAAAWLARLSPKFLELEWSSDQPWESFMSRSRHVLGDNISLTPMDARNKALVAKVLDALTEAHKSLNAQTAVAVEAEARVRSMELAVAEVEALRKKCDELEGTIKGMNTDMNALRKQVAEFQGKMPVSHDELMQNIKNAIKDGMKGVVVAGAAGVAAIGGAAPEAAAGVEAPAENAVPDDFGFGASGSDSDGFGF